MVKASNTYIHTFIPLTLYPRRGSRGISDIAPRRPSFTKITKLWETLQTWQVVSPSPSDQSSSVVIAVNPLLAFPNIYGRKIVLFFYFQYLCPMCRKRRLSRSVLSTLVKWELHFVWIAATADSLSTPFYLQTWVFVFMYIKRQVKNFLSRLSI
jgi:hypothetical protein